MRKRIREPWTYKKVTVIPVSVNSSGIRWCAFVGTGHALKSDTKAGMRELITQHEIAQHEAPPNNRAAWEGI